MNREPEPHERNQIERHRELKSTFKDSICDAVATGESLHTIAGRGRMPRLATIGRWLAEDETFRARYEKARAIGRMFVLDDVLAFADAPDAGRADIRLKLAARKWWIAEIARDAKARKKSVAELRYEAEARAAAEAAAQAEAERAQDAAEKMRREMEDEVQFLKSVRWTRTDILRELDRKWPGVPLPPSVADELPRVVNRRPSGVPAPARKPAPKAASTPTPKHETALSAPAPEPVAAPPPPVPAPTPKPVRSLYDLSALPPPKRNTEMKTMKDWDPLDYRSY